jgi:CBS-domain-containing membrane protein
VSPTVLIIWFIVMAVFTASVLVVGTMLAADLVHRRHRPRRVDSEPRVLHGSVMRSAPPEDNGSGHPPVPR